MKIYQVRAKRGKLKYYEEHIHYTLDGSEEYNWRLILSEINDKKRLSLPSKLDFITDKLDYKKVSELNWLKCDFRIPIISNRLLEFITENENFSYDFYPIQILNKKNSNEINRDFVAFYLRDTLDCLDKSKTNKVLINNIETFDFKNGIYRNDISYPLLFKIDGVRMLNTHYCTERGREVLTNFSEGSFDFYELREINIE